MVNYAPTLKQTNNFFLKKRERDIYLNPCFNDLSFFILKVICIILQYAKKKNNNIPAL
jgi:hypothetical protein